LLSKFAFKFNLRRYNTQRTRAHLIGGALAGPLLAQAAGLVRRADDDVAAAAAAEASQRRGLTLVHVRAQLEQLQDTFLS